MQTSEPSKLPFQQQQQQQLPTEVQRFLTNNKMTKKAFHDFIDDQGGRRGFRVTLWTFISWPRRIPHFTNDFFILKQGRKICCKNTKMLFQLTTTY